MNNQLRYYEVQEYAEACTSLEPEVLRELYLETYAVMPMPQMISGHLQGRVLAMMSKMIRPSKILEVGTFTGYSTLCLAEGLADDGMVYTIDRNRDVEEIARKYFVKAGLQDRVKLYIGDALSVLDSFEREEYFDFVFIDADKKNCLAYYNAVLPLLKKGGFMAVDNMLWHGRVLAHDTDDKRTAAILALTDLVLSDSSVEVTFLPVRDGIFLIRKKC
jgi:caffeoyl-CoA O-methyltransferase